MTETTQLILANKSNSLRSTIPYCIVKQFHLNPGDQIEWYMKVIDNELQIIVNPKKLFGGGGGNSSHILSRKYLK